MVGPLDEGVHSDDPFVPTSPSLCSTIGSDLSFAVVARFATGDGIRSNGETKSNLDFVSAKGSGSFWFISGESLVESLERGGVGEPKIAGIVTLAGALDLGRTKVTIGTGTAGAAAGVASGVGREPSLVKLFCCPVEI